MTQETARGGETTAARPRNVRVMQGNEACAEGALAAGVNFFAGYPITPSSEVAEVMSERLPKLGGQFIQMEDEIASIAAIIGASLAGAKTMTATSGPGYSLMQENIGYACIAEVPCLIVNVQRGGPSTGLPTLPSQADVMQARWGTHGDHPAVALTAIGVEDTYRQTIRAVNLAERLRMPVSLMLDEIVGHVFEKVHLPDPEEIVLIERPRPVGPPEEYRPFAETPDDVPPLADFGRGYRFHVTGLIHDESGFPSSDSKVTDRLIRRLMRKVERHRDEIVEVIEFELEDAEVAAVAYGATARASRQAVRMARAEGIKAGLLILETLWPFPDCEVARIAERVKGIVMPELNLGQMVREVQMVCCGKPPILPVNRVDGTAIEPTEILDGLRQVNKNV